MKINYLSALLGSLIILFAACTKITSTDIGTGLIPAVDGVITKDTIITVYAKNAGDSIISPTLSQTHVVGYVDDPLFGTTDARINFQLSLPSTNLKFESTTANLYLDSIVLVLSYDGIWGDSNKAVTLHVNEIDSNQEFIADTLASIYDPFIAGYSGYYDNTANLTVASSLTDVPTIINPVKLDDSVRHYFLDSGINMVRIKLNSTFGERLLNYQDDTTVYKSDSSFRNHVKGLQVYADAGSNSLLKIGLTDANTKLALYYRYHPADSAASVMTPTVKYFTVNGTSAHSNYIVRNRSLGTINSYLPPLNVGTPNDDLIFIQAGPGTYATITIDSAALAAMPNYIIHRAELLMDQDKDPNPASDLYLTAPNLFLLAKDDTSRFVIPGSDTGSIATADAVFSSSYLANYSGFGGLPKENTTNNSLYSFNISRYVQGIVTKHYKQYSFVLYAPYNEPFKLIQSVPVTTSRGYVASTPANTAGCGRVRLYGGGGPETNNVNRMRLHIVYSVPH